MRVVLERDISLLLTASIDPGGVVNSTRNDPKEREQDYCEALRFYLNAHPGFRRVVLIDNSGWPLTALQRVADEANPHGSAVELISRSVNTFPRAFGKGYGESRIFDEAMSSSKLLRESSHVCKITGRLRVANASAIVRAETRDYSLLCDVRDHGLYELLRLPATARHCDTRMLVWSRDFFEQHMRGLADTHSEGELSLEHRMFELINRLDAEAAGGVIRRFRREPVFQGFAGHGGKRYDTLRERSKRLVRATARRVAPWWHI